MNGGPAQQRPERSPEHQDATPAGDDQRKLSIGQMAEITRVSSRTIRYYEDLGILPEPERSPGGTRKYTHDHRFYVEGALALKELGFSLDEIKLIGQFALERPMTETERHRAIDVVHDKMSGLEHKIRVLEHLRDVLRSREKTDADPEQARRELTRILQDVRREASADQP
ncbi:MAG: MerR family transcriptional regulator [Actinomycetota bacterium]|jgi:DNA-binding transcriptional MerR regulator|nr:MerR family transcriptional regulator [Actinomycetota bacterium]